MVVLAVGGMILMLVACQAKAAPSSRARRLSDSKNGCPKEDVGSKRLPKMRLQREDSKANNDPVKYADTRIQCFGSIYEPTGLHFGTAYPHHRGVMTMVKSVAQTTVNFPAI